MEEKITVNIIVADYDMKRIMEVMLDIQLNPNIQVAAIAETEEEAVNKAVEMEVDAVLMEYTLGDRTALDVVKKLKEKGSKACVFAVSTESSKKFVNNSKKAGISGVFSRKDFNPVEAADLIIDYVQKQRAENTVIQEELEKKEALQQVALKEKIPVKVSQSVILTYNTKGGVGKSSIATNLALALKMSKLMENERVALVDFDCVGGNIATLCHIPDMEAINRNLLFWEGETEKLTEQEVDDLMIQGPNGVMVLPAPLNAVLAQKVNFNLCNNILKSLKKYFSIIVIDGAASLSPAVDAAIQNATHIVLITNTEGQSVKQLAKTVEMLSPDPLNPEKADMSYILNKMFLVINRIQESSKWDLQPEEVEKIVGRPLVLEIPFTQTLKESLHGDSEKQAFELDDKGDYAFAIKKLANFLVGAYSEEFDQSNKKSVVNSKKQKKIFSWGRS